MTPEIQAILDGLKDNPEAQAEIQKITDAYEMPTYSSSMSIPGASRCSRCSALVERTGSHSAWHENTNFAIKFTMRQVVSAHDRIDALVAALMEDS